MRLIDKINKKTKENMKNNGEKMKIITMQLEEERRENFKKIEKWAKGENDVR